MESNGGITREWLDELLGKNDIVSTVSRYIPLERKGRQYWGRCPFHHEKTPSFAVDENRQFYHCFGCGESGDAIKFVQKSEGIDFMAAVKLLAEHVHMEIPSFKVDPQAAEKKRKRDDALAINKLAARFYHANLKTKEGQAAARYLEKRGVSLAMITRFGLGVSLDFRGLVDHLRTHDCDLVLAEETGLIGRKDNGQYYDAFGGRLIFPIIDSVGNIVAFGGRLLEKSDFAKYRNTKATFLFDKTKSIYAINLIKKLKLEQTIPYLILCEGYVDVIALHQAGFVQAVASMGTSLTKEQARLLKRFTDLVIISYDGDGAGQKATLRGLEILREEGLEVRVIALPDKLDPDEYIQAKGVSAYHACIEAAEPFFSFKLKTLANDFAMKTNDGKLKFATLAAKEIVSLDNTLEQETYFEQVSRMTGFTIDSLKRQAFQSGKEEVVQVPTTGRSYTAEEKAVRFLLFVYINRFPYADTSFSLDELLENDAQKEIYRLFVEDDTMTIARAYQALPEALHAALAEIADDDQGFREELQEEYYTGCVKMIRKDKLEKELKALSVDYDNALPGTDKSNLLTRIMDIQRQIKSTR